MFQLDGTGRPVAYIWNKWIFNLKYFLKVASHHQQFGSHKLLDRNSMIAMSTIAYKRCVSILGEFLCVVMLVEFGKQTILGIGSHYGVYAFYILD